MRICLAIMLSFLSVVAFSADVTLAPVVEAGQDSRNTQMESVGTSWQSMQNAPGEQNTQAPSMGSAGEVSPVSAKTSGALEGRVDRLSQQVANIARMNLPQQVTDLRKTLSDLQGQIEVAQRDLKMLSQQQARLYQDLSQRMARLQSGKVVTSKPVVSSTTEKLVKATDASSYQQAFKLLSSKQFDRASDAFTMYLKDYPKGRFAANAHYWLGEIAMQKKAYGDAYAQFQLLIAQYPDSNKVSDAKLKVAVIHALKGKKDLARIEFQQVQKDYPGSTAAQLASIQLQQMHR